MPISFLGQSYSAEAKLKARQLVREFASHRFGLFKESGFRSDPMYPTFASVAGLDAGRAAAGRWAWAASALNRTSLETSSAAANETGSGSNLRGFDQNWTECQFNTSPASGLPASPQAAQCAPYLVGRPNQAQSISFNLMSSDPFSYADLSQLRQASLASQPLPLQWRELAEAAKWHFCGDNFAATTAASGQQQQVAGGSPASPAPWFEHNQRATNKQNKMCAERSALEVIKSSEDFRRTPFR